MNPLVERCVGAPAVLEELKHKPGRRLTLRVRGPRGSAILKLYRSGRAAAVAERISALAGGPPEPTVPRVLALDSRERLLLLSDVPGTPLREAVLSSDVEAGRRAGAAIARWHGAWTASPPPALEEHTIERELDVLLHRAAEAPRKIGLEVAAAVSSVTGSWTAVTVVHRDLYEEQVLLDRRVGLIDLDDAALGPPELDVGNLLAHLDLLAIRSRRTLDEAKSAILDGYEAEGALDAGLLVRCRTLARLRLGCIHAEPRLVRTTVGV